MSKYGDVIKQLDAKRKLAEDSLEYISKINEYFCGFYEGLQEGLNLATSTVMEMDNKSNKDYKRSVNNLWYPGNISPETLKSNNRADYILICRALKDVESEGVVKDQVYIVTDYWTGDSWTDTGCSDIFEVLYWAKLKWIRIPLPFELRPQKDSMFLR